MLQTERLTLRPIALEDFPRWAEMMADPEASRFLGGVTPASTAWLAYTRNRRLRSSSPCPSNFLLLAPWKVSRSKPSSMRRKR